MDYNVLSINLNPAKNLSNMLLVLSSGLEARGERWRAASAVAVGRVVCLCALLWSLPASIRQ